MLRSAMYPIVRAFTSIAVAALLLGASAARAADGGDAVVGFEDSGGKTVFLHDFKGKPVLINLWATWCEPCVREMPSLAKLQQQYAAQGLVVIAISEDDNTSLPQDFYKKKNITNLPFFFDKDHGVYTALMPRGLPTTVLVNRQGSMVNRIEGPVDWQSKPVLQIVDKLMKE